MFSIYKRTIEVYCDGKYMHSTNAYRLCREAAEAARELHPRAVITARFTTQQENIK